MIKKKISEEVLIAIEETFLNCKDVKVPNSHEEETDMVNNFINDFKKQLDQQGILRVEVLSKWIKIFYIWLYLELFLF